MPAELRLVVETSADQLLEVGKQPRHGILESSEFGAKHHYGRNRAGRNNGCGSLVSLEHTDLTHDVSRPELCDEVVSIEDVGRPSLDDKQLIGKTILLNNSGASRDIHFVSMLGDGLSLPTRQPGEQRKIFDLGWIHRLLSILDGQDYRGGHSVAFPSQSPQASEPTIKGSLIPLTVIGRLRSKSNPETRSIVSSETRTVGYEDFDGLLEEQNGIVCLLVGRSDPPSALERERPQHVRVVAFDKGGQLG